VGRSTLIEKINSAQEKIHFIIEWKGESRRKDVKDTGVVESTLKGWLKEAEKLRGFCNTVNQEEGLKRKRTKTARDPELDKSICKWFSGEKNGSTSTNQWDNDHPASSDRRHARKESKMPSPHEAREPV